MKSMDPEHASIAGRLFFSQAEKNQKAKRRGEKLYGEGAALRLERQNSLRSATAAPRRRSFAAASPAFLRAPALRTDTASGSSLTEPPSGSHRAMKPR